MIETRKIIKYDCFNKEHNKVYKKISNFNFLQDETFKLICKELEIDYSGLGSIRTLIMDGEFCISVSDRDVYYIISAYDILVREPNRMEMHNELTKLWRKTMINTYGDIYKKRLIRVLNQRRIDACKEYDKQINELIDL